MSEYHFVEKPLLIQLRSMGWTVIEQGSGIPQDPALSLRSSFREIVIKSEFIAGVNAINRHDGKPWLTAQQLEDLYADFCDFGEKTLLASNREFINRLYQWQVDENTVTGETNPVVKIIAFEPEQSQHNRFVAINQYRVDTPASVGQYIIPDVVLLVNGLPLVVIECKDYDPSTSNPMFKAIEQLRRYANMREADGSMHQEGEAKLFWSNQLMVASYGNDCKFGSITSFEEYYFNWKTRYPDSEPYADQLQHRSQEQLVQGMLRPAKLLDITRSFTLFMDSGKKTIKVICRYQQYRAVKKMLHRLRNGQTAIARSGVVWHTQGSGKSLTMVFLVRKMRRDPQLKDYKILMVNDRKDLDKQLSETAKLTGEKVHRISSLNAVKSELKDDASTLNMVMIHKFREPDDNTLPTYLRNVLTDSQADNSDNSDSSYDAATGQYRQHSPAPIGGVTEAPGRYQADASAVLFTPFETVNAADKILILIDEAHRTQRAGQTGASLSDNLFDAFPNATRLAFTGTPLIAEHHKDPTWQRFGSSLKQAYIDQYKLQDAVDDGATLQILYEGRTAETAITDKAGFDNQFEDLFIARSDEELAAIKQRYGTTGNILEAEARIEAIARDLVAHYSSHILPSGFKAQVVCSSKKAALHYQRFIRLAIADWIVAEQNKPAKRQDPELLRQMQFIDAQVIISFDGTIEDAACVAARAEAKKVDAIENFKKAFDYAKPETGVAFLVVCDMLLTGFDAPIEQVMYIDKKLKEHNLLQAIARVNRTYRGKSVGYVVDYIGLTANLEAALSLYAGQDQRDIKDSFKAVESEMPVLESRYRALNQLFEQSSVEHIEALVQQTLDSHQQRQQVSEAAIRCLEDIKTRDSFNVYFKKFSQSMDIIMPNKLADPYKIPLYQYAYILAVSRERYKDDSMDIAGAGEKVRKLINAHLISLGINPQVPPVELFSPTFIKTIKAQQDPRAAASEMEHAIRKHCKVNAATDPVLYQRFSEKLDALLKNYHQQWQQQVLHFTELRQEMEQGRGAGAAGTDPFSEVMVKVAFAGQLSAGQLSAGQLSAGQLSAENQAALAQVVEQVMDALAQTIDTLNFWQREKDLEELKGTLNRIFILSKVQAFQVHNAQLTSEVIDLAQHQQSAITRHRGINSGANSDSKGGSSGAGQ